MGLSSTVSEINGDFCRKSQIFPIPLYLTPPLRDFPLEFCNGGSAQKTSHSPIRRWKEIDDMCIRFDPIPDCDGQTDGFAITISRLRMDMHDDASTKKHLHYTL